MDNSPSRPRMDGPTNENEDLTRSPLWKSSQLHSHPLFTDGQYNPDGPPLLPPIPRVASVYVKARDDEQDNISSTELLSAQAVTVKRQRHSIIVTGQTPAALASPKSPFSDSSSFSTGLPSPTLEGPRPQPPRLGARAVTSPVGSFPTINSPRDTTPLSPLSPRSQSRPLILGVPYSSTTAQAQPRVGGRPLHDTTITVNGVPQHAKTSSPRPELVSQKAAKNKFSLLSPKSLLMRRRSSQIIDTLHEEQTSPKALVVPPMNLPEGFDPRIRGNVVHDFSAPRAQRSRSYNITDSREASGRIPSLPELDAVPAGLGIMDLPAENEGRTHSMFIEHVDEEVDEKRRSAVQAETLANPEFVSRNAPQDQEPLALPPYGRKSQILDDIVVVPAMDKENQRFSDTTTSPRSAVSAMSDSPGRMIGSRDVEFSPVSPEGGVIIAEPNTTPSPFPHVDQPKKQPRDLEDRSPPLTDGPIPRALGLPRHAPSNASRFSFQTTGNAEEKLLEERHKLRNSRSTGGGGGSVIEQGAIEDDAEDVDEDEEEFDEDAMYDHDEMEPVDDFQHSSHTTETKGPDMIGRRHSSTALTAEIAAMYLKGSAATSTVASARSSAMPGGAEPSLGNQLNITSYDTVPDSHVGQGQDTSFALAAEAFEQRGDHASPQSTGSIYFDDGTFEAAEDEDDNGQDFDEDNFDDPAYLKRSQNNEAPHSPYGLGVNPSISNNDEPHFVMNNTDTEDFAARAPVPEQPAGPLPTILQLPIITESGLAAYHNALAVAAQNAADSGRFTRQGSIARSESVYSVEDKPEAVQSREPVNTAQTHTRIMSASTHQSHPSYSGFDFGFNDSATIDDTFSSPEFPCDDFGYSDDLDMVAAANAEALASDDEGFYSQEFGFYAKARSGSDASDSEDAFAGGYFGPPGIEIIRQRSVKEPNLTPITERSEFSTRNSFISAMGHFSPLAGPLSPAWPHLARAMSPLALAHRRDEELSLADLRRLSANALGGSSTSLRSSHDGGASPMIGPQPTYTPIYPPGGVSNGSGYFGGLGSVPMMFQYSNDSNASGSPVIATDASSSNTSLVGQNIAFFEQSSSNPATTTPKKIPMTNILPPTPETIRKIPPVPLFAASDAPLSPSPARSKGHSRNGSDTVTYVREDDAEGGQRWVLERRRPSEGGLLELVGREVVEGGRI